MPLISASNDIRHALAGGCKPLAISRLRQFSGEQPLGARLLAIFAKQSDERLVFGAEIARQVLLAILLTQIPLAVVHKAQRPSRRAPGAANAAERPFMRVPIREIV